MPTTYSTLREEKKNLTATLERDKDWPDWDHDFRLKADTLDLFLHAINGIPLQRRPELPNIAKSKYTKKANTSVVPVNIPMQELQDEPGPDDDEVLQIKKNEGVWTVSDLTNPGKAMFDADTVYYDRLYKEYEKQTKATEKLKDFVITTVAKTYKTGKATSDEREDARQDYKQANLPLSNSRNAAHWLDNWEVAYTKAQKFGVPDTGIVSSWANDFIDAINDAFPTWANTYRIAKDDDIRNGILSFRSPCNDFRKMINRPTRGPGRASRGAFASTYDKRHAVEEDSDAAANHRLPEKKNKNKRKKSAEQGSKPGCLGCGQDKHELPDCWYIFTDKKPDWFHLNSKLIEKVKENMEDPELAAHVRALKKTKLGKPKKEAVFEEPED
ncbi:hypothetical protein F5Y16DRAFT_421460 [Xylariaceae sp. FL0255]|nr:hypothetical protein F5Y16DRAFT_421460 [Xylariaceae sp. FL0255]